MTNTKTRSDVATIAPRLSFPAPAVMKNFGLSQGDWLALVDAIYPNAKTAESVILALSYCRRRNLDPFKRPVHIVPIWTREKNGYVDTIWPGIGELRTTAHRTGQFAGMNRTEFGPDQTEEFQPLDKSGRPSGKPHRVTFPAWAQVTVQRRVGDHIVNFAGPEVYWLETYAQTRDGCPNEMWRKRPRGQIAKCAEAAALRAAFPEEIGEDLADDEAGILQRADTPPESLSSAPERPTRSEGPNVPADSASPSGDAPGAARGGNISDVVDAITAHGDEVTFTLPADADAARAFLAEWGVLAMHELTLDEFMAGNGALMEAVGVDPDQFMVQCKTKAAEQATASSGDDDAGGISQADFDNLLAQAKTANRTGELVVFVQSKRVGNVVGAMMDDSQRAQWAVEIDKLKGGKS